MGGDDDWNRLLVVSNIPATPSGPTEIQKLVQRFGTVQQTLALKDKVRDLWVGRGVCWGVAGMSLCAQVSVKGRDILVRNVCFCVRFKCLCLASTLPTVIPHHPSNPVFFTPCRSSLRWEQQTWPRVSSTASRSFPALFRTTSSPSPGNLIPRLIYLKSTSLLPAQRLQPVTMTPRLQRLLCPLVARRTHCLSQD